MRVTNVCNPQHWRRVLFDIHHLIYHLNLLTYHIHIGHCIAGCEIKVFHTAGSTADNSTDFFSRSSYRGSHQFNVSIKEQHSTKRMRIFRFLSHDLVATNGYQYWWFQVERAMALNQPISQASIVQTFFTMVCRCAKVFLSARLE